MARKFPAGIVCPGGNHPAHRHCATNTACNWFVCEVHGCRIAVTVLSSKLLGNYRIARQIEKASPPSDPPTST